MELVEPAKVLKEGILSKLGGSAGGHKNWKDRYFVLSDHLYYYDDKKSYEKNPKAPTGRVVLTSYYCSKVEDSTSFEFIVNAYPKSLTVRASSAAEMEEWISAIMGPLAMLSKVSDSGAGGATAVAAAGAGKA